MNFKIPAKSLTYGSAVGVLLCLSEPISFWGGVDPLTGVIHDQAHPEYGQSIVGKILVLDASRGSSSGSYILLELMRAKMAPAGIVISEPDGVICTGVLVGQETYSLFLPVIQIDLTALKGLKNGSKAMILSTENTCEFDLLL